MGELGKTEQGKFVFEPKETGFSSLRKTGFQA